MTDCGTRGGYYRHVRAGESPCDACKPERNQGASVRPYNEWGGLQPSGSLFRALDKLQVDGGWLSAEQLAVELGVTEPTMRRALWRLRERGMVEDRRVPITWEVGQVTERIEWRAVALPDYWGMVAS